MNQVIYSRCKTCGTQQRSEIPMGADVMIGGTCPVCEEKGQKGHVETVIIDEFGEPPTWFRR